MGHLRAGGGGDGAGWSASGAALRLVGSAAVLAAGAAMGLASWRRRQRNSPPMGRPPGKDLTRQSELIETGAGLLQDRAALGSFTLVLHTAHPLEAASARTVEAHLVCSRLSEDLVQALMFDGNTRGARLVGVEYMISDRLYATLPDDERPLWHAHRDDVMSGLLAAPGLPAALEREVMAWAARSYGKASLLWDSAADDLPVGMPELLLGYTAERPADAAFIEKRDKRMGISTALRRERRKDLRPVVAPSTPAGRTAGGGSDAGAGPDVPAGREAGLGVAPGQATPQARADEAADLAGKDRVQAASEGSFPASDPPARGSSAGAAGGGR